MDTLKSPETYDQIIAINVDIQNDFCPNGALAVTDGDEVVEPMNAVNRFTRGLGGIVLFTRDWHPRVTQHFNTMGGPWPPHCIAYHAGAAFHHDLLVDTNGGDLVASKGMRPDRDDYSGLMATIDDFTPWSGREYTRDVSVNELIRYGLPQLRTELAKSKKKERIGALVGGLATDYCVKATVLDLAKIANNTNLDIYVIEDAVRAVNINPGDGDDAIAEMKEAGAKFVSSYDVALGRVLTR